MPNYRRVETIAAALMVAIRSQSVSAQQTIVVPPDTTRWEIQGRGGPVDYLGRKALLLDGGQAELKGFELRDGVIDVEVAASAKRGFFGIIFRANSTDGEYVYLRPHKSGEPDAVQYTPILNTGLNWQIYSGAGFTAAVDIPRDTWFHIRLEITGAQAKLYVSDLERPALVMSDLKSGVQRGSFALAVLQGATYFSNVQVRPTPDAAWERHLPAMPPNTITDWAISPAYDALQRNLEQPLSASEIRDIHWQPVQAEPPGFVPINRYRSSPHPRVTFQTNFATRLDPQPGMQVVYARTTITSRGDAVKKLMLGYSDDVSVFLNGRVLFRGRSAQSFRDPAFLGIISPDDDAVYLPLKDGANELVLAVSELGGGWGFVCRLVDTPSLEQAGQPPQDASPIRAVEALFNAMRESDSAAARRSFLATARVVPVRPNEREPQPLSVDQFVQFVASNAKGAWDERLSNVRVDTMGALAAVRFDYDVRQGGSIRQCGTQSVQLSLTSDGWRIVSMAFTASTGGCQARPG